MLTYYLELALRAMRSYRGLTALMLLSIAMGVAACMTTLTVFHVMSGDPIPQKSSRLFNVQLDAESKRDWKPGDEPEPAAHPLRRRATAARQARGASGHHDRLVHRGRSGRLRRRRAAAVLHRRTLDDGGLLRDVRGPVPLRQRLVRGRRLRPKPASR